MLPISTEQSLIHGIVLQMDGLDLWVALAIHLLRRTSKGYLWSEGHSQQILTLHQVKSDLY